MWVRFFLRFQLFGDMALSRFRSILITLIDSRPDNRVQQWAVVPKVKNKMSTSEVCATCLAWLCELFVGPLISLTNEYASCGRTCGFGLGRSIQP